MIFFTISNLPKRSSPLPLSKISLKPQYVLKVNSEGVKFLVKEKDINIYDEVQVFKDECSIYNIIRRYELGDTSVLNRVSSSYVDTLGQPKTMQEALNLAVKLKNNFSSFKPEVQSAFGNDFNKFLVSIADGSAAEILSKFNVQDINSKEDSVNE